MVMNHDSEDASRKVMFEFCLRGVADWLPEHTSYLYLYRWRHRWKILFGHPVIQIWLIRRKSKLIFRMKNDGKTVMRWTFFYSFRRSVTFQLVVYVKSHNKLMTRVVWKCNKARWRICGISPDTPSSARRPSHSGLISPGFNVCCCLHIIGKRPEYPWRDKSVPGVHREMWWHFCFMRIAREHTVHGHTYSQFLIIFLCILIVIFKNKYATEHLESDIRL